MKEPDKFYREIFACNDLSSLSCIKNKCVCKCCSPVSNMFHFQVIHHCTSVPDTPKKFHFHKIPSTNYIMYNHVYRRKNSTNMLDFGLYSSPAMRQFRKMKQHQTPINLTYFFLCVTFGNFWHCLAVGDECRAKSSSIL